MTLAPIYIYSVESYYYSYVVRAVYYSTKRFKLSVLFIYIDDQAYRKDDKSCRNLLKLLMVWICGFARVSPSKSLKRRLSVYWINGGSNRVLLSFQYSFDRSMNREDLKGEGERVREVFACNRIKRVFVAPSLSFFSFGLVWSRRGRYTSGAQHQRCNWIKWTYILSRLCIRFL